MGTRHRETNRNRKMGGFTAFELLMVLAIVAILALVSVPSLLGAMQNYRLNGAARRITSDLRFAQSLAVTRGGVYGFHWGGDPLEPFAPGPNYYRIERNTGTGCNWPPVWDTAASNPNVVTNWLDLSTEFQGVTIASVTDNASVAIGGAAFNARGASANPCTPVGYPLTITVTDASGTTRTIQVRSAGSVRVP